MFDLATTQNVFVRHIPKMEKAAKIQFRHFPPDLKEESVTNSIALTWKAFYRLFVRGRAHEPGILGAAFRYSLRQCRAGRLPQGCPKKRETLAPRWVGPTRSPDFDLEQFVSRTTPVPDAVSFRVDVPQFMGTLPERNRNLALDLAQGMTTTDAARKYSVTPGAISQFRARFKQLFDDFFAA